MAPAAVRAPALLTNAMGLPVAPTERNQYALPAIGVPPPSSLNACRPVSL